MSKFHKPYIDEVAGRWLVYAWSPRWNRYVNTHMFNDKKNAHITLRVMR